MKKIAIFPGSFDPITNGHIGILKKAIPFFDEMILLLAINPNKEYRFTNQERKDMAEEALKEYKNVSVCFTDGLTVDFAKEHNAKYIIRGLRNDKDFEYEKKYYIACRQLNPSIEFIYFVADDKSSSINSTDVMNKYKNGEDISHLVPSSVLKRLK